MATAVIMPKVGITVETCIITEWRKKVGDQIKPGDVLFSYETDKTSVDCLAETEGELLEIFHEEGDEVACFENVCAIGKHGEDCSALRPGQSPVVNKGEFVIGLGQSAADAMAAASKTSAAPLSAVSPKAAPAADADIRQSPRSQSASASPRAKELASLAGVDWTEATPSGPRNLIIERDVRKLMQEGSVQTAAVTAAPSADNTDYTDAPLSHIRQTIARAMYSSLQNTAQLTHNFMFDASELFTFRKLFKQKGGDSAGITIGDMILFAVARTLPDFPDLNAHLLDGKTIRHFQTVHLAVAVDTPRGLLVPVIRNAEQKSLRDISQEVKRLAAAASAGTINPDDLTGGSFTVSNLGSFGVTSFTPILNPPQVGIIGACRTVDMPRRSTDGSLELYPAMTLSLTYDHRAIDGAPASRFMQEVCRKLENFSVTLSE